MNKPRLNRAQIAQLKELLGIHYIELVTRFLTDGTARLQTIKGAILVNDFDAIYAEAHGLKGSARNVGADRLAQLCEDLEGRGKQRVDHSMQQLFAAIEQEFAAVREELAQQ